MYSLVYSAKIKSIQEYFSCSSERGWKFFAVQCVFENMDHLAMWQARPFWIFVSMMNEAILQAWEGSFSVFTVKTLKIAAFECKKKCLYANEIANWVSIISNHILMNQCSQNGSTAIASALCIKAAKKVHNFDLSCSNSGYSEVSIGISICYKCWKNTFPSYIAFLQVRL